jgi:hypothetical protein
MSMYLPNGSRMYCKNPADYAKIAEKILAREPLVITVTKDGVMTEGIFWDPDDQERLQVLMSYVPPKKPKLWRKFVSQVCRAKAD